MLPPKPPVPARSGKLIAPARRVLPTPNHRGRVLIGPQIANTEPVLSRTGMNPLRSTR